MILSASCFHWIPVLCKKLVDMFIPRPKCEHLPENIIAEILSRLPAKHVYQCRMVCQQWNSLISTTSFNEMYLKRGNPAVIFHIRSKHIRELCFIDEWGNMNKWWWKPRTRKICASDILSENLKQTALLSFSYNGLLVFSCSQEDAPRYTSIILNPITQDKVILHNYYEGEICGLFFHPKAKEYRVLWQTTRSLQKNYVEFKILSLTTQPCWRRLSKLNVITRPIKYEPPVNLYDALHWMSVGIYYANNRRLYKPTCSQFIIIFSIVEEEFRVMPHPGDISKCSSTWETHEKLHLLDLEGQLSACKCSDILEIWVLEDYGSWFWTKRHNIKLESDYLDLRRVKPLGMQNGALVLYQYEKGLLSYHLQEKTIKEFIFEQPSESVTNTTHACLHTDSLVSLREFPVKIFMP